ncbi:MAG: type II secretion system F family protein [Planctomycetaceae bacterium]
MTRFGRLPGGFVADVLGRVSVALAAGIDPKRAWESEAARAPARRRPPLAAVAGAIASGSSLAAALDAAADAFGPVVRGMAVVADHTGRDAEVLRDVADAVRHAVRLRREFLAGLVTPALQLAAAVATVGLLIVVSGGITGLDGEPLDLVGLGLRGMAGLRTYLVALAAVAVLAAAAVPRALRSWKDRGIVRRAAAWIPVLGPALGAAESAAWCRAAALAAGAGIDAGGLVGIASSAAPGLRIDPAEVEARLRAGADLAGALAAAGRFDRRVIEAVEVGEMAGTTPEGLDRLAAGLEAESRAGLAAAARAAGFLAWAGVALLVTLVVIRFFSIYAGLIRDAAKPL